MIVTRSISTDNVNNEIWEKWIWITFNIYLFALFSYIYATFYENRRYYTTRNVKFVEFYRIRRILYRKEILGTRWINSKIRGTFEKYDEIIAPISPLDSLIALQICFYLEGWFCFPWHCTTYILRSKTNLLRFWNEVIWLRFVNYISNKFILILLPLCMIFF